MVSSIGKSSSYIRRLNENVKKALIVGAMAVEQRAKENAPVDTGTMMRSVSHTPVLEGASSYFIHIGPGPEAPYAIYTEEEPYISQHGLGRISEMKNASMPWLKPALEESREDILNAVAQAIRRTTT
jgi:hypothetical protein